MSAQVAPLLLLSCHCAAGVGLPVAEAVKVTGIPAVAVRLDGLAVMVGGVFTVSVAGLV